MFVCDLLFVLMCCAYDLLCDAVWFVGLWLCCLSLRVILCLMCVLLVMRDVIRCWLCVCLFMVCVVCLRVCVRCVSGVCVL